VSSWESLKTHLHVPLDDLQPGESEGSRTGCQNSWSWGGPPPPCALAVNVVVCECLCAFLLWGYRSRYYWLLIDISTINISECTDSRNSKPSVLESLLTNVSRLQHIHICDMTHAYVRHDSFVCTTWLSCMCGMARLHVRSDLLVCAMWLILMRKCTRATWPISDAHVRHDSFIYTMWLICMRGMALLYAQNDLLFCPTWLSHMHSISNAHVRRDSFISVTRLSCIRDMAHSYARHKLWSRFD